MPSLNIYLAILYNTDFCACACACVLIRWVTLRFLVPCVLSSRVPPPPCSTMMAWWVGLKWWEVAEKTYWFWEKWGFGWKFISIISLSWLASFSHRAIYILWHLTLFQGSEVFGLSVVRLRQFSYVCCILFSCSFKNQWNNWLVCTMLLRTYIRGC